MKRFKEYLVEYELSDGVVPSHVHEKDIDKTAFEKHELGSVDGHRVTHYKSNDRNESHHTFVTDASGKSVGHIEHAPVKKKNRLAISNITKTEGSKFSMGNVLHHLIKHGHELVSDKTNTEHGAHRMLMNFARRPEIHTHIEDGKGKIVAHEGDITSSENQKKYTVKHTDKHFLDDDTHKRTLVFKQK